MNKFLLVYYGGKIENDPAKAKQVMAAWMAWFQKLGKAIVDAGAPTMPGKIVSGMGMKDIGREPVTGYSIVQAENKDAAVTMAKGCPIIADGGQVAVYAMMSMQM